MAAANNDGVKLFRWIQHQDAEAFKTLVDRYGGMVYATSRRILGSPGEAEDVAQECFESLARFDGPPPDYLGPWLHRVATNLACKRIRSATRRRQREEAYAAERPASVDPPWDDVYRYVDEAIDELPERLRGPLVAHFIEGQTHARIAETLGVSRQTVTDRVGLGVKHVRRALARRNITISIPLLAGFLGTHTAEAAPAALTATLGKLALSGVRHGLSGSGSVSLPTATMVGGMLVMKKVLLGLAVCLLILIASGIAVYFYAMRQLFGPPELPPIVLEQGDYAPIESIAAAVVPEPELAEAPDVEDADPDGPFVTKTALLRGRVVDEDGRPVSGAAVQLERKKTNWLIPADLLSPFEARTESDGKGYFQIEEIPTLRGGAGGGMREYNFHLRARKEGRAAYQYLEVSSRIPAPFVELVLIEGGVLAGVVHDDQGVPIEHAAVAPTGVGSSSYNVENQNRGGQLDRKPAITDAQGRFHLANVVEGSHRLEVRAPGFGRYISDFYRNGDTHIDISLPRGQSISGVVLHEKTGEPIPDQMLVLNPLFSFNTQKGLSPGQIGRSNNDGTFHFAGLVFGPYEVLAIDGDSPTMQRIDHARAAVIVAEGEDVTGLKVLVSDGAAVEGRLLDAESRQPIPYTQVWIVADPRTDYSIGRTVTDEKGQFRFAGLSEGDWLLQAMDDRQRYRVALRVGEVRRNTDILVSRLAPITGRVFDGEGNPLADATVTALGSWERFSINMHYRVVTAVSDESGNFQLAGLTEPDTVTVQARHALGVSPRSSPFRWGRGGKRNVTLTIEATGHITGTVVDRQGLPVAGARLMAYPNSDRSLLNLPGQSDPRLPNSGRDYNGEPVAVTGPTGHFDLGQLLADTYNIEVEYRRVISQHRVVVEAGALKDDVALTIDRRTMGALEGTVTWGPPLQNVLVHTRYESVSTDESGRYRFDYLPEGECYVHVDHHRIVGGHETSYNVHEKVVITAGGTARLDLTFPTEGGSVEGTALLNGAPASGATVEASDMTASVGADGHYRIDGLPEGAVSLRLLLSLFDKGELDGSRKEVEVRRNEVSTVDFDVYAGSLHGQVSGLAEGERCAVLIVPGELDAIAMPRGELAALFQQSEQTIDVRNGGPFYLTNAPAGPCTVIAVAYPEDARLDSRVPPDARVQYEVVDITGGPMPEIEFYFP